MQLFPEQECRTPSGSEETVLIGRILAGRKDLFDELLKPHLAPLWRVVQAKMGTNTDVEDVVQQTLLKAYLHLEQFRSEARFSTWLIRIALREILQRHRLRWSSLLVALDPPALCRFQGSDETASPYKQLERMETNNLQRKAIAELPEKYQALIVLRDMQGVSVRDAARLLGMTVPAVKTRHRRARLKMAHSLAPLLKSAPRYPYNSVRR
jgi:RNA polymerase sigma-70 factor, ECF subfamily